MARTAIVLPSAGLGGAESQAVLVGRRLRTAGHTVAVFAMDGGSGLAGRCVAHELELQPLPRVESRLSLLAGWRLRRAGQRLLTWKPDLLLPFCSAPNVLGGVLAATGGPPTAWNQRDEGLFPQHARHERQALAAAAVHTANGPGAATWLRARGISAPRLIGNALEEQGTRKVGLEITVRLENGQLTAVTQEADEEFRPGERVRLLSSQRGVTRVSH